MRAEFFDHTGDLGIHLYAESLDQLFEAAAAAVTSSICDVSLVESRREASVALAGPSIDLLFVDWLDETLVSVRDAGPVSQVLVAVTITRPPDGYQLIATLSGDQYDHGRHRVKTLIKAVTYHRLSVIENGRRLAGYGRVGCVRGRVTSDAGHDVPG